MKNMKVSAKLITGFLVIIALGALVGASGISGLHSMSNAAERMYSEMATPLGDLGLATEYFQRVRVQIRNAIIYTGDAEHLRAVKSDITNRMENFETDMAAYEPTIAVEGGRKLFREIMDEYHAVMKPGVAKLLQHAEQGMSTTQLLAEMATMTAASDTIADDLRELTQVRLHVMSEANDGTTALYHKLFVTIVAAIALAVGAGLFFAFYISGLISKPLAPLALFMRQAATTGDIVLKEEDHKVIGAFAERKDEIGKTIAAAAAFVTRLGAISGTLETVSRGDLTAELAPLSDQDTLGHSLRRMTGNLNGMFGEIRTSTALVSDSAQQVSAAASSIAEGATQMTSGSIALAEGSTKQAASIQELSGSVAEITDKARETAHRTEQAAALANTIIDRAVKGSRQMDEMTTAVKDITEASRSIHAIVETISNIADQTNLLALNAAIEAARAGALGRGFAVVAEEVRKLAGESANAVQETNTLIQNSIGKAELGTQVAEEMASILKEIVAGIDESSHLIMDISKASEEQSVSIDRINHHVEQVAAVVEQNSALAQESAAAAEECAASSQESAAAADGMNSQASTLENLISQFKLRDAAAEQDVTGSQSAELKKLVAQSRLRAAA